MAAFRILLLLAAVALLAAPILSLAEPADGQAAPQAGKPVPDKPEKSRDRMTTVSVLATGTDSIGSRLATRLKERFNQSNLFVLNDDEGKDVPKMGLQIETKPEFPSRPNVGSVYSICWTFSQGRGYLRYLLATDSGIVASEDIDALVDKIVERTDGIAAKYSNLWK